MTDEQKEIESNNIKIIITAIFGVLIGVVFILALINFGMGIQRKLDSNKTSDEPEKIVSIIAVDYSSASFDYKVKNELGGGASLDNYLISLYDSSLNQNYLVIESQDMLDTVLGDIRIASGNESITYDVDEKFFYSGSIVMVTSEEDDLYDFKIASVTRDENYNIQVDAKKSLKEDNCESVCNGKAIFIKIRNIQPKSVSVNITKEDNV